MSGRIERGAVAPEGMALSVEARRAEARVNRARPAGRPRAEPTVARHVIMPRSSSARRPRSRKTRLTPKASPETASPATQSFLETTLGPLRLKNPLLAASGCFGYGEEAAAFVDPGVYGGIIGKSISVLPRR